MALACQVAHAERASTLHLSGSSWIHDAPTRIAELQGYFDGPGPAVTVSYESSGKASLQQLLAGEADFALAATIPVARALLETPRSDRPSPDDLVVLATVSLSNQTHHVLAASDRGIAEPRDLTGRRIGVLSDTSAEFFWSVFAPLHGFSADAAELVDMPPERMSSALRDGSVDAVLIWDPWVFRIERELDVATVRFSQRQIYTLNWLLVTRRRIAEEYPRLCDRLLRGYLEANELLLEHPDRAIALQGQDLDLPAEYVAAMHDKIIYHLGLNWSVLTNMEHAFDWLIAKYDIEGTRRPSPALYVDPRAISRVAPGRMLLPDIGARAATASGP